MCVCVCVCLVENYIYEWVFLYCPCTYNNIFGLWYGKSVVTAVNLFLFVVRNSCQIPKHTVIRTAPPHILGTHGIIKLFFYSLFLASVCNAQYHKVIRSFCVCMPKFCFVKEATDQHSKFFSSFSQYSGKSFDTIYRLESL